MLVDDAEVHHQMGRQLLLLEVATPHINLCFVAHMAQQNVDQVAIGEAGVGHEGIDIVRQRHEPRTRPLVQALGEHEHLVFQHAGNQPVAAVVGDLVERIDGHGDGHAVFGVAGRMQVAHRAIDAAQANRLRERRARDARRLMPHQLLARQQQEVGLTLLLLAEPAFERVTTAHIDRQLLVIKRIDQLVVHQHVLAARLVLKLFNLRDQLAVGGHKGQPRFPLAIDQSLADENLARSKRIHIAEVHALVVVDHDAVERGTLERNHLGRLLLPMRLEQLRFDHVAGDARQPLRLDRGNATAEEPSGLDQLGRDDPAPRFLRQVRARVPVEANAARTQVPVVFVALAANVAEQAGQHRQMDLLVSRRRSIQAPAVFGNHGVELRMNVAPLAHAAG